MPNPTPSISGNQDDSPSAAAWILIPAVVMSLGWGLRGYIGGGPYGAMIPGALVSLMLCQYLRFSVSASAVVVAFGAFGVGFGGNMTYGQTLGLIREADTFLMGLYGTTTKGAVWGLLGGAVLGLGFAARHIAWRNLVIALIVMLIGIAIGICFVNVPKLIYFSDPINKPRDESWAGLLAGAFALLAWIRIAEPKFAWMPLHFAAFGAVGGAIGFGIGSLFLTWQANSSDAWRWLPFWKFMEFFFGFSFGAALGLCGWHLNERLRPLGAGKEHDHQDQPEAQATWFAWLLLIPAAIVVFGVFYGWNRTAEIVFLQIKENNRTGFQWTAIVVLLDFTGLGCVLMLLSRRWEALAWQAAISVAIVAAAIDWQRDLLPRGEIDWADTYRQWFVWIVGGVSILAVFLWRRRHRPELMNLFSFAVCVFMGIGYMMGLAHASIWLGDPDAEAIAGGRMAFLWQEFRGEVIVHCIFTTLFIISVWAAVRDRKVSRRHAD